MTKQKISQTIVVEGKYDAARLADYVDATILCTGGFDIYTDPEKRSLLKKLARQTGLIILTDSDAAGFQIRRYVADLVGQQYVRHAYAPAMPGKEKRKAAPGKEGLLGVEGIEGPVLLQALQNAGAQPPAGEDGPAPRRITYSDLYEWGLSGGEGSAQRRRAFLKRLELPLRLSKKALVEVLNTLYTYEQLRALCEDAAPAQGEGKEAPDGAIMRHDEP